MKFSAFTLLALTVSGLLLGAPGAALSQTLQDWNPQGLIMERAELQELESRLEAVANSSGYSGRIREEARQDAEIVRERLERGDFRTGDEVRLTVEGETEIPEIVPVQPGPRIVLPIYGEISLDGVLRSEIEEYLTRELGRYIQDPVVNAEARVMVSIQGDVGTPGFFTLPGHMLLSEALMQAGGPSSTSDLEEMRIERAGQVFIEGEEMTTVLADGRTLDQLNLRAGDQIMVPAGQTGSFFESGWWTVMRWGLGIGASVLLGSRVFL